MSIRTILPNIHWVGAIDWNMHHFHGHTYTTKRGTTYNAYLIIDDKIALIDAVHKSRASELLHNIRAIVPPEKIDYIIVNHIETDHAGALDEVVRACPRAQLMGTARCKDGLFAHFHQPWNFKVVKTGDSIKLGARTLKFFEAPMIHWPDSMFTYVPEDQLLLPNDAFGQHYATSERFDDEVDPCALMDEAEKYYANILWPLGPIIAKKLEEIKKINLPIRMIAPSHGIIWRKDPGKIIAAYASWVTNPAQPKAVICYETMWGATDRMAHTIADGISDAGIHVKLFDITQSDPTEVMKELFQSKGYLFRSSTHDNNMLPSIAGFLHFLKGMKPKNRIGAAFGSYGWAGGAVKSIETFFIESGITQVQPSLGIQFNPDQQGIQACYEFGKKFADAIKK